MKIAVVGRYRGLSAAWLLRRHADVTVYEQNAYAGGHTHTFQVPGGPAVDTGFIVFNERNYPHLTAMFRHLRVESQASEMSFSASIGGGRSSTPATTSTRSSPSAGTCSTVLTGACCCDIIRFNRDAKRALKPDSRQKLPSASSSWAAVTAMSSAAVISCPWRRPSGPAPWAPCSGSRRRASSSSSRITASWISWTGRVAHRHRRQPGICEEVAGFLKRTRSPGHPGDRAEACRRLGSGLGFERGFLGL